MIVTEVIVDYNAKEPLADGSKDWLLGFSSFWGVCVVRCCVLMMRMIFVLLVPNQR